MHHSFDIEIASQYGVNEAIFLNNLAYWIKKNQANNKHFHDGRYWTYNSMEAFTQLFPYWTFKQIRTLLKNISKVGLVLTGNYNKKGFDRTTWYALSDEAHKLLNLPICPKGQTQLPEEANPIDQKGNAIPDNKPNTKNKRERARAKSALTPLSADFILNEENKTKAQELGLTEQETKLSYQKFMNYFLNNKPDKKSNWVAEMNTWLIREAEHKAAHPKTYSPKTTHTSDEKKTTEVRSTVGFYTPEVSTGTPASPEKTREFTRKAQEIIKSKGLVTSYGKNQVANRAVQGT